jgi:hypothetical protein
LKLKWNKNKAEAKLVANCEGLGVEDERN